MRKKIFNLPLALVMLSVLFLFSPFNISQSVKLSAIYILFPIRGVANGATELMQKIIPSSLFDYDKMDELQRKMAQMEVDQRKLADDNVKLKLQLENLAGLREAVSDHYYDEIIAEVLVPSDASGWRKSMTIVKGSHDGIQPGMSVVWGNNIIGKISKVGQFTSEVILLTDVGYKTPAVVVPKYVEEKVTKRDIGVVEGAGRNYARLKWIPQNDELKNDWLVITAGDPLGEVPNGLVAGKIIRASFESSAYYDIQVQPLINFRGLEFVVVLKKRG